MNRVRQNTTTQIFALAVVAIMTIIAGCSPDRPAPPPTSQPTPTHTIPDDGTLCSLPKEYWEQLLGETDLDQYFLTDNKTFREEYFYGSTKTPTIFNCRIHPGTATTFSEKIRESRVNVTVAINDADNSELLSVKKQIAEATPEQQFTARGYPGFSYPGYGIYPDRFGPPGSGSEIPGGGELRWACEQTMVMIAVDPKLVANGPAVAMDVFNHIVDDIKCEN